MPHKRVGEQGGKPELYVDMCFLGEDKGPHHTITVMVPRERSTRMTMATVVPAKSARSFTSRRLVPFMKEVGILHQDVLVKSDQEPAVKAILSDAGRVRSAEGGGRYLLEQSPVGSSARNGVVERAIQSVEARAGPEKCPRGPLGRQVGDPASSDPVDPEHAAVLLNRFGVGHDGKTAYERNKGKTAMVLGMEFGEATLWKRRPVGGAWGKLSCFWEDGLYLGIRGQHGELVVSDRAGVWRTWTVQKKPIEDRWPEDANEMIQKTPWTDADEDDVQGGTEKLVTEMTEAEKEAQRQVEFEDTIPARFCIRMVVLE